ncbi:MAG: tyrosine-type recombinase/integrase [bacterium]|nr:tyrosine-type recombinase/integrase [bacterium]
MLDKLFPRTHLRYASLPVLGHHLEGFVVWLHSAGYPKTPIRRRIRAAARLDGLLQERSVHAPGDVTTTAVIACAPKDSQEDIYLSAVVRSLVRYLEQRGERSPSSLSPTQALVAAYQAYLENVRGFAASTVSNHTATIAELLASLDDDQFGGLDQPRVEAFLKVLGERIGRASLQHAVAHVRSFLRFLTARGDIDSSRDICIDTPRVYRGEQLPRALPWETVQALLASVDRSTSMGQRDYAMLLMVVTYGLRTCEVVGLTLDDIDWRDDRLLVHRPKVGAPILLPLTQDVGAALIEYLQHGRPDLPCREVFLRVRAPAGTLKPTALTEVFQGCVRRSGLPIPFQGPHCLRHSLAVHLLRQGMPLKTIGDLLGHRSAEATCIYLRLHVEDLRDVALELPTAVYSEVQK